MEHVTVQKTSRISKLKVGIAAVALGALLVVPSAGAQDSVTQQVTGGELTSSIAAATLDPVAYSHVDRDTVGASLTLSVDDSTGNDDGWNVTVLAGAFTGTATSGNATFAASNLLAGTPATPTVVTGQEVDTTNGPSAGVGGTLDTARKVISANAGFGKGDYRQNLPVTLTIPGQTLTDTYTSTLTVTNAAGPGV